MKIKTRVLPADEAGVAEAAQLLRQGQLVALPTETVYGIAADARNGAAVRNIFVAKGRPQDNPLIVHVTGPEMLPGLVSEVPERYLFVEKYSKSLLKPLRSFAEGLKRDIDAVENAVAYDYSNGFVEGTNSRLKMIKRTMYGRCGRQLLEAKLRYMGYNNNNG